MHLVTDFKGKVASAGHETPEPLRVLNRGTRWAPDGLVYLSDHRHVGRLITELELKPKHVVVIAASCGSLNTGKKAEHEEGGDPLQIAAEHGVYIYICVYFERERYI